MKQNKKATRLLLKNPQKRLITTHKSSIKIFTDHLQYTQYAVWDVEESITFKTKFFLEEFATRQTMDLWKGNIIKTLGMCQIVSGIEVQQRVNIL